MKKQPKKSTAKATRKTTKNNAPHLDLNLIRKLSDQTAKASKEDDVTELNRIYQELRSTGLEFTPMGLGFFFSMLTSDQAAQVMGDANDDGRLIKLTARIEVEAEALITRKREIFNEELSYHPVELLATSIYEEKEFYDGLPAFWDFARMITQVKNSFNELIKIDKAQGVNAHTLETSKDAVIELIQHVGFYRKLISQRSDELEKYLKEIDVAEVA